MELVILGSGTCVPSLNRGGPSQLIEAGASKLLIDTGLGTLRSLLRLGITYNDISHLLFTHIHPDHTAELVPFLFACKYSDTLRTRPLKIIGGAGFRDFFHSLESVYGKWIKPDSFDLEILELVEERISFEGLEISTKKTAHIKESVGFRVESGGKSIAVSGDTGYCPGVVALAQDSDLLVVECSHPDGFPVEGHLTPSLVGQIASEAGCKRVLLSHFYPAVDFTFPDKKVRESFSGEVLAATDLFRVNL
ncbi:MAG: MBL fold metallo-hydrolase [Nitrospinota bacterium]